MESEARTRIWWAYERGYIDVLGSLSYIAEEITRTLTDDDFIRVADRFGDSIFVNPAQVRMIERAP